MNYMEVTRPGADAGNTVEVKTRNIWTTFSSNFLVQGLLETNPDIYYFSRSDNIQFTMDNSGFIITWWCMIWCSVSIKDQWPIRLHFFRGRLPSAEDNRVLLESDMICCTWISNCNNSKNHPKTKTNPNPNPPSDTEICSMTQPAGL